MPESDCAKLKSPRIQKRKLKTNTFDCHTWSLKNQKPKKPKRIWNSKNLVGIGKVHKGKQVREGKKKTIFWMLYPPTHTHTQGEKNNVCYMFNVNCRFDFFMFFFFFLPFSTIKGSWESWGKQQMAHELAARRLPSTLGSSKKKNTRKKVHTKDGNKKLLKSICVA